MTWQASRRRGGVATPIADKNEIPGEQTAYATLGIALANPVNVWDRGSVSTPVWQRVAVEGLS